MAIDVGVSTGLALSSCWCNGRLGLEISSSKESSVSSVTELVEATACEGTILLVLAPSSYSLSLRLLGTRDSLHGLYLICEATTP